MFIAVSKRGRVKAAMPTVTELLKHIKTTRGVTVLKVSGEVSDDCLTALEAENKLNHDAMNWFTSEFGVKFSNVQYVDLVSVGTTVVTRGGPTYEVTCVHNDSDFLYRFDGVQIGGTRTASWTADGFYYTKDHPNDRDVVEVLGC